MDRWTKDALVAQLEACVKFVEEAAGLIDAEPTLSATRLQGIVTDLREQVEEVRGLNPTS